MQFSRLLLIFALLAATAVRAARIVASQQEQLIAKVSKLQTMHDPRQPRDASHRLFLHHRGQPDNSSRSSIAAESSSVSSASANGSFLVLSGSSSSNVNNANNHNSSSSSSSNACTATRLYRSRSSNFGLQAAIAPPEEGCGGQRRAAHGRPPAIFQRYDYKRGKRSSNNNNNNKSSSSSEGDSSSGSKGSCSRCSYENNGALPCDPGHAPHCRHEHERHRQQQQQQQEQQK
mmetsp:Transcript_52105/g.113439  ORF Transcript_52105/g.113439 Transcript_52105/m.113439 type:complete len:232 (+) Transcript_52105:364-1059(+)